MVPLCMVLDLQTYASLASGIELVGPSLHANWVVSIPIHGFILVLFPFVLKTYTNGSLTDRTNTLPADLSLGELM